MVAGRLVLFLRARPSFGAMRQESHGRSTASSLAVRDRDLAVEDDVHLLDGRGVERGAAAGRDGRRTRARECRTGPASRPCRRTIRMSSWPGAWYAGRRRSGRRSSGHLTAPGPRTMRSRDEPMTFDIGLGGILQPVDRRSDRIGNGFRWPLAKPGASSRRTSAVSTDDRARVSMPDIGVPAAVEGEDVELDDPVAPPR